MPIDSSLSGSENDGPLTSGDAHCFVVGIGASAGGLRALKSFFRAVSPDSGLAYVVVVHLAPEHESHLVELLQVDTSIPVHQVTEDVTVEPNHVYVIPPNANLVAVDSHLHLARLEKRPRDRGTIDHFFRTLATSRLANGAGVILSGSGSDGTAGIMAIKSGGGLTVAQDPGEAEFAEMPKNAIASGALDLVLPVRDIPDALLRFTRAPPRPSTPGAEQGLSVADRVTFSTILTTLATRTGRNFSRYKTPMVLRLLGRRMELVEAKGFSDYLRLLDEDPDEAHRLADSLLITVSSFFRDPEAFASLAESVIPKLFEDRGPGDSVRVWSVGCATGEEAYSIAMVLIEEAERHDAPPSFRVFATDLHQGALNAARAGLYPGDIAHDVGEPRLARFFRKEKGGYRIVDDVRERVVFAAHNVLGDPPFFRLDLVVCRNLLIYLKRDVHPEVMEIFHYALAPGRFLALGAAETVGSGGLFEAEDKKQALFRRVDVPTVRLKLPVFPALPSESGKRTEWPDRTVPSTLPEQLHRHLVGIWAPPSVLVSPYDEVVHFSENAGRYHVQPHGAPAAGVTQLVREELRSELSALLHEVRETGERRRSTTPIEVHFDGAKRLVILDVCPAANPNDGFMLVCFEELDAAAPGKTAPGGNGHGDSARVQVLETEVGALRERVRLIVEGSSRDREEARVSVEELYSGNEELRSTLEELETSKEEFQSMNEELRTLDEENRQRVQELGQLTDDLQNLLTATHIATVFLDLELRILRFTPAVEDIFRIKATDKGRHLSDLAHRLAGDDLVGIAREAMQSGVSVEHELRGGEQRWYLARAQPYRVGSGETAGIVLTFIDITLQKETENARQALSEALADQAKLEARRQEERFRRLVEASAQTVWATDAAGCMEEDSPTLRSFTGQTFAELKGEGWMDATHPDDRGTFLQAWHEAVAAKEVFSREAQLWHDASQSFHWMEFRAVPLEAPSGSVTGWIGMNVDINDRRQSEAARERSGAMLTAVEQGERRRFSQLLHDDLQQLLYAIQMKVVLVSRTEGRADAGPTPVHLQGALDLLDVAIAKTRQLGVDLSPPVLDGEGFAHALHWLQAEMLDLHGLTVEVQELGDPNVKPKELRLLLFQATRELLFNSAKHSGTDRAKVEVEENGAEVKITVSDAGCGFDPGTLVASRSRRGFGLTTLRERLRLLGGRAEIDSRPGGGTRVVMTVPLRPSR